MDAEYFVSLNVALWSLGLTANTPSYIAIVGPTASGKSKLAMQLAARLPIEIISCDSVQIYRHFDIGSAKPSADERAAVPHHLIDVCDFGQDFDAFDYSLLARKTITDCHARGKVPVVVGGTGLYLRALWGERFNDFPSDTRVREEVKKLSTKILYEELLSRDLEKAKTLHPNDRIRIVRAVEIVRMTNKTHAELQNAKQSDDLFPPALVWFIHPERAKLRADIATRVNEMFALGWVDEVETLIKAGATDQHKPMQSIGYREIYTYVTQKHNDLHQLSAAITTSTRQYAKRQISWFKSVQGNVEVLDSPALSDKMMEYIERLICAKPEKPSA